MHLHLAVARANLHSMPNIEMLLELTYILPMLEAIHSFIKFSQLCDVFVSNCIVDVSICWDEVY